MSKAEKYRPVMDKYSQMTKQGLKELKAQIKNKKAHVE